LGLPPDGVVVEDEVPEAVEDGPAPVHLDAAQKMRPVAGDQMAALVYRPVRELDVEVGRAFPADLVDLARRPALVGVEAVQPPVRVLADASNPALDPLEIRRAAARLDRVALRPAKRPTQEAHLGLVVVVLGPVRVEAVMDVLVLLVAESFLRLPEHGEDALRDVVDDV